MSETVTYKGKAKSTGLTAQQYCLNKGFSESDMEEYRSWEELFYEKVCDWKTESHCIVKGEVFEVISFENLEYESIFQATKNEDGSYDFLLQYYDGGCSFGEALEEAVKNA